MKYLEYLKKAQELNKNKNVNKLILVNLLKKDLTWLYANLDKENTANDLSEYLDLVKKYSEGYPLGYILGYVIFDNYKLFVDHRVLIPRDETHDLVKATINISQEYFINKKIKVLDLATGSGFIAVSLAFNKNYEITASDVSSQALQVAKKNIDFHNLKNVKLVKSDLFNNLTNQKFDVIISNPPYIDQKSNTYCWKYLAHEPEIALFAKNNGLFFYQEIFSKILNHVNDKFLLAFEFGFNQKAAIEKLIKDKLPKNIDYFFVKDINEHWRYLFIKGEIIT